MAVTAQPYGTFMTDLGTGTHNLNADTDKVALLTPSYSPDLDTHDAFDDVNSFELSSTNYTAGGATLTGKSLDYNPTSNTAVLSADPVSWDSLTGTIRYAVVYRSSNSAINSRLIGVLDLGEDRVFDDEPFQLSFPSGVVTIQAY